jgi:hypothetical protein
LGFNIREKSGVSLRGFDRIVGDSEAETGGLGLGVCAEGLFNPREESGLNAREESGLNFREESGLNFREESGLNSRFNGVVGLVAVDEAEAAGLGEDSTFGAAFGPFGFFGPFGLASRFGFGVRAITRISLWFCP